MNANKKRISLPSLFINFFLIGCYSFGGYMALISIVRKDLVEKKKQLTDEQILDGVSLASILPGPVAVNAVTYYGYILAGIKGAMVSFIGVLLPTFLLVTGFSIYYFSAETHSNLDFHISFVIPVVVAVIISVGINMSKKQIRLVSQACISILAFIVSILAPNVLFLIGTIVIGGVFGYFFYNNSETNHIKTQTKLSFLSFNELKLLLLVVLSVVLTLLFLAYITDQLEPSLYLTSVFSSMSLTLFGGGYVIIPIMEQAVVIDLAWLSIDEFNAAISISQITPGPIMTSVTFIGYKMAGITGAIVGTLAIFLPSSLLMIILSNFQERIKNISYINGIMKGMRAVVIGLIFSGAYAIGVNHFDYEIIPWIILVVSLLLFMFTKIHPALIIISTLLFSFI